MQKLLSKPPGLPPAEAATRDKALTAGAARRRVAAAADLNCSASRSPAAVTANACATSFIDHAFSAAAPATASAAAALRPASAAAP